MSINAILALLYNEEDSGVNRKQLTQIRHQLREIRSVALLNDVSFKEHFRLSRSSFEILYNKLAMHIKEGQTAYAITRETKLFVTLRFLAQGSYQLSVGNDISVAVSKSSVSVILKQVLRAMNDVLCPEYITLPTPQQQRNTRIWAARRYHIPGVIGMIDGTHIAIVAPKKDGDFPEFIYVNRKNYHSLNTQIICDHKYRIWNVNARFPGSAHDSHIWKNSSIRTYLLNNYENQGVWILGDSGYPLEPILMTPFRAPDTQGAIMFNEAHSKCRSTVERCIGVLKARWRCLKLERGLHYHPTMAADMVNACVGLHNFCLSLDEDYINVLPEPTDEVPTDNNHTTNGTLYEKGSAIRDSLIGYLLQHN